MTQFYQLTGLMKRHKKQLEFFMPWIHYVA